MAYLQKAVRGGALISGFILLSGFIAYGSRVLLARTLTPADYGLFFAVYSFAVFFFSFLDLGTVQGMSKFIAQFRASEQAGSLRRVVRLSATVLTTTSFAFALVLFFAAPLLASAYFQTSSAVLLIRLFSLYVILRSAGQFLRSYFNGHQRFSIESTMEPARALVLFLTLLIGFIFSKSILIAILAYLVSWFVIDIFYVGIAFFKVRLPKPKKTNFTLRALLSFSLPVLLFGVGSRVITYTDTLILTFFVPLAQVGVYNVVLPTAMLFITLGTGLRAIIFPMTSELRERRDNERIRQGLTLIHKYTWLLFAPIIASLIIASEQFLIFFFSDAYVSGALSLMILLVGVLVFLFGVINNSFLSAMGKPKVVARAYLVAIPFNVIGNFLLIPPLGIIGGALTTMLSYCLLYVISHYEISKVLGSNHLNKFKLALTTLLFSAIFWLGFSYTQGQEWHFIWSYGIPGLIALLLYVLALFAVKVITWQELKHLGVKQFLGR